MKTTSICPHVNCLVNHNGNPCNCNMAQYCSQCKKENPIPPSAQTEWSDCICTDYDGKGISPCGVPCPVHNKKQYNEGVWLDNMKKLPKPLQRCMMVLLLEVDESIVHSITDEIVKAIASERTRLRSLPSMKMEEENDYPEDLENGPRTRNSLRQSILSEIEKGTHTR